MSKRERKIEDIKSVGEFYKALKEIVANTFNSYDSGKFFDGWTEEQKKLLYGFGTHILSNVYEPIRKRYTKQERKKCEKILNDCNEFLGQYQKQVKDLQSQLDQQKAMWNELKEFLIKGIKFDKEEIEENKEIPNLPNRHYLTIENIIIDKMQELEKGEKDD